MLRSVQLHACSSLYTCLYASMPPALAADRRRLPGSPPVWAQLLLRLPLNVVLPVFAPPGRLRRRSAVRRCARRPSARRSTSWRWRGRRRASRWGWGCLARPHHASVSPRPAAPVGCAVCGGPTGHKLLHCWIALGPRLGLHRLTPRRRPARNVVALQDILQRAGVKEQLLSHANREREADNDRRRIERELYNSLRLDKVDSIQKTQVGEGDDPSSACWRPARASDIAWSAGRGLRA